MQAFSYALSVEIAELRGKQQLEATARQSSRDIFINFSTALAERVGENGAGDSASHRQRRG